MITRLADVVLKSGEAMQVLKITAPEPQWCERILEFLVHKGPVWLAPMETAYNQGLEDLVINDFLGVLESGEVVGNITTVEFQGCAILQHVFTPEVHRRKGICNFIIHELCEDFKASGGRGMYLGTGYDTHPYYIYQGVGFVGRGDSGKMTWLPDSNFLTDWFRPATAMVRDLKWSDWPCLEALYATEGQWQLKGAHFRQFGHTGYESQYVYLRVGMDERNIQNVKILASETGAVVGHAFLAPQEQWKNKSLCLDFMVHENFYGQIGDLLNAVEIPTDQRVVCYCDVNAQARIAALETLDFVCEGILRKQIEDENHNALDVAVLARV